MGFVFPTSPLLELFTPTREFASVCKVSDVFCRGSWALMLGIFWLSVLTLLVLNCLLSAATLRCLGMIITHIGINCEFVWTNKNTMQQCSSTISLVLNLS